MIDTGQPAIERVLVDDRRRVASGGAWTAAAWIVGLVAGPGLTVVLVREMPANAFGGLAIGFSIASVLAAMAGFGMSSAVAQVSSAMHAEGPSSSKSAALEAAVRQMTIALVVVAVLVCCLAAFAIHGVGSLHDAFPAFVALTPTVVVAPVIAAYGGRLRAAHAARRFAMIGAVPALVTAVTSVVLLGCGLRTALPMAAARAAGSLVLGGALAVAYLRHRRPAPSPQVAAHVPEVRRRIMGMGAAMFLTVVFTTGVSQLDVFLVGAFRGSRAVAAYAPLSRVADSLLVLAGLMGTFYLPVVAARIARGDHRGSASLYRWASRWNVVVCAPFVAVALFAPRSVLVLLYGSRYAGYGTPMRILAAGVAAHIVFGYNGLTMDAHGRVVAVAVRQGVALVASVMACVLLIPLLGLDGAAVATTATLVFANALCSGYLYRRQRLLPWDRSILLAIGTVGLIGWSSAWLAAASGGPPVARVLLIGGLVAVGAVAVAPASERRAIISGAIRRVRPGHARPPGADGPSPVVAEVARPIR